MRRRRQRVQFHLESIDDVAALSNEEINKILRAADEIIYSAGRAMLAKILKGSKDKRLLELKLDICPSYGYFQSLTIREITKKVDWMLINGYLDIEYNGRLPMIVFTEKGWTIYKRIYVNELYNQLLEEMHVSQAELIETLKKTNREVVHLLLYKIGDSKNIGFIRFLENWKETEVRKVRMKIDGAIKNIKS